MRLIGLDFESSGSDPWGRSAPIQIGIASIVEGGLYDDTLLTLDIGGWDWNEWEWSEEAEEVHGIPRSRLLSAEAVWKVDIRAANWLLDRAAKDRYWNIAVGWNVGSFDRQFVTRHFHYLDMILSYRTIDLNSLVFDRAIQRAGKPVPHVRKIYNEIKGEAKGYAQDMMTELFEVPKWHDAGYDALAALFSLDYLQKETA